MPRETGPNMSGHREKSNWEKFEDKIMSNAKPEQNSGSVAPKLDSVEDRINYLEQTSTPSMVDNGEIPLRPKNEVSERKSEIDPIKYLEETSTGYLVDNGELPPSSGTDSSRKKDSNLHEDKPTTNPSDLANTGFEGNKVTFTDTPDTLKGELYEHSETEVEKRLPEALGNFDSEGNEYVKIDSPDLGVGKVIINKKEKQPEDPVNPEPLQITHQEYDPSKVPVVINEVKGVPAVIEDPEEPRPDDKIKQITHIPYDPNKVPVVIPKNPNPDIPKSIKLKGAVVDTSDSVKRSRHIAEAEMTATAAQMTGVGGFMRRVWKFGLARHYYGAKAEAHAREQILSTGNAYIDRHDSVTAQNQANVAILDRFLSEYDNMVHDSEEVGEKKDVLGESEVEKNLKIELQELIRKFAANELDEGAFEEEKKRLFADLNIARGDVLDKGLLYADNILELAKQVRELGLHNEALANLDIQLDLTLGRAKTGARTKEQLNSCESLIEKLRNTRLGCWVGETTVATAVAAAYQAGLLLNQRAARSKLLAWGTLFASTFMGGAVGYARESNQVAKERAQHMRERAEGSKFNPDAMQRAEMEQFKYNTRLASEMIIGLNESIDKEELTEEEKNLAIAKLAEADSLVRLSDNRAIDLIAFSSLEELENERYALDLARAKLRCKLKEVVSDLDNKLETQGNLIIDQAVNGDEGIDSKDELFKKYKTRRVAKAVVKGMAIGGAVGTVFHQVGAYFNPNQTGVVEGAMKGSQPGDINTTWLEAARRYFSGDIASAPGLLNEVHVGDGLLRLPEGVSLIPDASGNGYELLQNGHSICGGLGFNPDGTFTSDSLNILHDHGINIEDQTHIIAHDVEAPISRTAEQYAEAHRDQMTEVARSYFNENGTAYSDGNEIRLDLGGVNNSGIRADGQYEFSVDRMTSEGSSHNGINENIQELIKEGKAKLALTLSRGTQKLAFMFDINPDNSIVIDPNSEAGRILLENVDGHAVFKGAMAEVVAVGDNVNNKGEEVVRMFATYTGEGYNQPIGIEDTVKDTVFDVSHTTTLDVPMPDTIISPPPVIPVIPHRPLEPEDKENITDDVIDKVNKKKEETVEENKEDKIKVGTADIKTNQDESNEASSESIIEPKISGVDTGFNEGDPQIEVSTLNSNTVNEQKHFGMVDDNTFAWFGRGKENTLKVPEGINLQLKQVATNSDFGEVMTVDLYHGNTLEKGFITIKDNEPYFVFSKRGIKADGEPILLKEKFDKILAI